MRSKTKNIKSGQGYGLTETMAFATVISGNDYIKNPTSCGKAIPLIVQVEIRDPETNKAVKDGQRGEVCIKSPMIMKWYVPCFAFLPVVPSTCCDFPCSLGGRGLL
jgi:long-subunit acyl-CoA synthetase (AMP-forming)